MKLIVGLGNIGERYENTRHNLGFMTLEKFFKEATNVKDTKWEENKKFKSFTASFSWQPKHGEEEKLILVKPTTHMNGSGLAVTALADFYKIKDGDIWVVHDELDLPLGGMKIRRGGSSAGHNGVQDIIEKLGTEQFWRFRLGIGESKNHGEIAPTAIHNVDDFVLGEFTSSEAGKVRELIKRGSDALKEALEHGIEIAMNKFNTK